MADTPIAAEEVRAGAECELTAGRLRLRVRDGSLRIRPDHHRRGYRRRVSGPRKRRNPGDDLFSRKAALSVSSALESLTSVFGMGTGVASPLESPGFHAAGTCSAASIAHECVRGAPKKGDRRSRVRHGSITDPQSLTLGQRLVVVKPSTISTAQLHPSPDFHVPPIKQVVSLRSYPVNPVGNLISRRASHLDAFSAYPCRT